MVDASATDTSAPQKKTLPVESLKRLQKFDEALTALEVAIAPILQVGFDDHMKRSALGLVRVDVMTMFVMNSLGWCLAALRGLDPKDDVQLADELRRTKQYVERLKSIETRKSAPGLNKRVAKAFVRNALWEVPSKRPREELPEGSNSADQGDSDVSDNEDIEHNSVSENEDVEHDDEAEAVMPAVVEQPSYAVTNIKFEVGGSYFFL
ncbi:hypothetical protein TELCIR_02335 [Teladorsagia circumcincta]|uniref:Nuclear nucleic acid-binding protein C1D n=1 Tax=Teladorsagia circumcincta TaxID=45464 RepID=A0A2G9UZF0_TELCI|nr:hypothetical protein TELCIR_02335 [Teladorsagia circumcincta]